LGCNIGTSHLQQVKTKSQNVIKYLIKENSPVTSPVISLLNRFFNLADQSLITLSLPFLKISLPQKFSDFKTDQNYSPALTGEVKNVCEIFSLI
jgi:hypothetical protein